MLIEKSSPRYPYKKGSQKQFFKLKWKLSKIYIFALVTWVAESEVKCPTPTPTPTFQIFPTFTKFPTP